MDCTGDVGYCCSVKTIVRTNSQHSAYRFALLRVAQYRLRNECAVALFLAIASRVSNPGFAVRQVISFAPFSISFVTGQDPLDRYTHSLSPIKVGERSKGSSDRDLRGLPRDKTFRSTVEHLKRPFVFCQLQRATMG